MGLKARDYIPALRFGAKIMPQDIAGMIGLPYVGNVWYVCPATGSDSAGGGSYSDAFATVGKAYTMATAGQHDVILLIAGGTTGTASNELTAITWSKAFTHLVGVAAPQGISGRARIVAGATGLSPFFTITAKGCIFANVQIGTFLADGLVNVYLNGAARNYFNNVHFAGIGHATAGDDASSCSLKLANASDENVFENCVIGLDTVARSTSNAELVMAVTANARNRFIGCEFLAFADNAGHFFVDVSANDCLDRFVMFKNCNFLNHVGVTGFVTMTDAIKSGAPTGIGGLVYLFDCNKMGTTGWADTLTALFVGGYSSNGTYANGIGFPVNPGA